MVKKYVYEEDVLLDVVMGQQSFDMSNISDYQAIEDARTYIPREAREHLAEILQPVFQKYDKDGNGTLDKVEVARLMRDVHC